MPKNRIFKAKDGRYTYAVTDASGNRLAVKSRSGESLASFRLRCDELDDKSKDIRLASTLDWLFNAWLDAHVRPNLNGREAESVTRLYERHVKNYIGSKDISDITRADVYNILLKAYKKGLAPSTIKMIRGCISRPYNWGINALGLPAINPTQGLIFTARDKKAKRRRVITDEDMTRFMEAAKASKYHSYFRVLQLTGMRPSEALGLQARDIEGGLIHVRRGITSYGLTPLKTEAAARAIPLTPELESVLSASLSVARHSVPGWLFPAADGVPSTNAVALALRRILRATAVYKCGGHNHLKKLKLQQPPVTLSLYDFRHTFATKLVQAGVCPKALQTVMGHENISVTMKYYVEMTEEMTEELRELMAKAL